MKNSTDTTTTTTTTTEGNTDMTTISTTTIAAAVSGFESAEAQGFGDIIAAQVEAGRLIAEAIADETFDASSVRAVAIAAEHTADQWAGRVKRAEVKSAKTGKRVVPQPSRLSSYKRAHDMFVAIDGGDVAETVDTFVTRCHVRSLVPTQARFAKYLASGCKAGSLDPKVKPEESAKPVESAESAATLAEADPATARTPEEALALRERAVAEALDGLPVEARARVLAAALEALGVTQGTMQAIAKDIGAANAAKVHTVA